VTLWIAIETVVLVCALVSILVLAQRVARLEGRAERHSLRLGDLERLRLREVKRREKRELGAASAERH
jgi:hypothetical protein